VERESLYNFGQVRSRRNKGWNRSQVSASSAQGAGASAGIFNVQEAVGHALEPVS
jgi:hypothetical protein